MKKIFILAAVAFFTMLTVGQSEQPQSEGNVGNSIGDGNNCSLLSTVIPPVRKPRPLDPPKQPTYQNFELLEYTVI